MIKMIIGSLIIFLGQGILSLWFDPVEIVVLSFGIGGAFIIWGAKAPSSKKISVSELEADIIKTRRAEDFD